MEAAPVQPQTEPVCVNRLKLHWSTLALLEGRKLLPDDEINAFIARLSRVTSHVTCDNSWLVLLGLKLKMETAAALVVDFVVELPETPLPEKADILRLLERYVDKKSDAYIRYEWNVLPSDEQYENLSVPRREFEDSHMEAALLASFNEIDVNDLKPRLVVGKNNIENIAGCDEISYFLERVGNGRPQFKDAVFADYFAAKWFAGHFDENASFIGGHLFSTRRTAMRYLFDCVLARGCDLHMAVLNDDVAGVRRLLEVQGVDASQRDDAGRTALHLAAARTKSPRKPGANREIMDILVKRTININAVDKIFAGSPLLYAEMAHSWAAVDKLLRCGAAIRHLRSTPANLTSAAMLRAIFEQDLDALMAFCLDRGLPVEHRAWLRLLPWACVAGSSRVASLLIARGADIKAVDGDRSTPLVYASAEGHLALVCQLVQSAQLAAERDDCPGAVSYVNRGDHGTTALHCAIGNVDIVSYLIGEGADPWSFDCRGRTPLHGAVVWGRWTAMVLIEAVDAARRANYVNVADDDGVTAMHLAAELGDWECVTLFGNTGADLMARDYRGWTPLTVSSMRGFRDIVEYLVSTVDAGNGQQKRDFVDAKDDQGRTALHWAVYDGHTDVLAVLLDQGARVDGRDISGKTPLDYALEHRRGAIRDLVRGAFSDPDLLGADDGVHWRLLARILYGINTN